MGIAGALAGSAVIGAGASLLGSKQASSSADKAAQLQQQQYATTRADLQPYNQAGQSALSGLSSLANGGQFGGGTNYLQMAQDNLPGQMTQAQLEQTPGYQFQLGQGLAATQNSAAARGLGVSGSALKGAATFATGLANSNYQTQFNNAQTKYSDIMGLNTGQQGNLTNQYNRLSSLAGLGESAAANTGTQGTALANQSGNYLNQAGLADAAGTAGVGKAATSAANNYLNNNLIQQQISQGGGTTGGYGQVPSAAQYNDMAAYNRGQLGYNQ